MSDHTTDAASSSTPRNRLSAVIPRRPRVTVVAAVLISLAFAALTTPLLLADSWIGLGQVEIVVNEPAPVTVRVPQFAGHTDEARGVSVGGPSGGGAIVVARGELVDGPTASVIEDIRARQPAGPASWFAYGLVMFLLALLFALHLRRSHRGRLLRTQLVTLAMLAVGAVGVKIALMLTPLSPLAVPVGLFALLAAVVVDLSVGIATGIAAAVLYGLLVPFDMGVLTVLGVQAGAATLIIGDGARLRRWRVALAGLLAAAGAAAVYAIFAYLSHGSIPVAELEAPGRSAWIAAALGGLATGVLALPMLPVYQWLLGDITKNALVELADLSNPLLKQIAEKSPGTWQHSLAMANMAEIAANAIGANGRLVRVGAYYHDLGKSLQPKYFIENLESGESSPHDRLAPDVSCDAIFAHVTEGLAVARRAGLPERVIDFMHMHHGDGVLEYFWAKCQETGNPKGLRVDDFRYPGVPPQSRETAILAICDAVEAASRTLKKPDDAAVRSLVQRIVYGKLHLGQLDESGLSVADLRKISDSLRETIKHAHHGRIEYPWQREAREEEARATAPDGLSARPRDAAAAARGAEGSGGVPTPVTARSASSRLFDEPRLDSLDAPRPLWRDRAATSDTGLGVARTQPLNGGAAAAAPPSGSGKIYEHEAVAPTQSMTAPHPMPDAGASNETLSLRPEAAEAPSMAASASASTKIQTGPRLEMVEIVEETHLPAAPSGSSTMTRIPSTTMPPIGGLVVAHDEATAPPAAPPAAAAPPAPRKPEIEIVSGIPTVPGFVSGAGQTLASGSGGLLPAADDYVLLEQTKPHARRGPPHPPPGSRPPPPPPDAPPSSTLEVDQEDIRAIIPADRARPGSQSGALPPGTLLLGPPPGTRPRQPEPAHAPAAAAAPAVVPARPEGDDEGPTVVRAAPATSMLPPRTRTHGKPNE